MVAMSQRRGAHIMIETFHGYQIDLSEGRHVFVASQDDCFYIRFRNADGDETRMKLSKEAGDALRYLLAPAKESPEIVTKWLMYMVEAKKSEPATFEWQAVKMDDAVFPEK
jgi:hypothetical protein